MKSYRNKKFYNFTDKQKRKDRSVKWCSKIFPSSNYKVPFREKERAQIKSLMIRIKKGQADVMFPNRRRSIGWYYW
jgi:hypothetical protein